MKQKIFREKMKAHNDTTISLSKALGISRKTLWYRLKGERKFTDSEIKILMDMWKLTPKEVVDIFFDGE